MLLKWHLDFNWSGLNWLFREAFGFICRDQATTGFLGYIFKFAITSSIIFLQRKPHDQFIPRVITGAQTLEWWRISWCAWKPPSRRPTRRRGESLLCMIVWSNARTAPWSVGKPWDFLFVCFSKVWFNSLCSDLEGLVPAKAQSLLLKKIEGLEQVMNKKINWNKLTSGGAGEYTCQDARSRNTRHWRAKSGSSEIRQWLFFLNRSFRLLFDHMFLDRSSWCCSKCPVRWEQQF